MAYCPKCSGKSLSPTLLASGLSAKCCKSCRGALVDLLAYRTWAEQSGVDAVDIPTGSTIEVDDTRQAIACPNCCAVMIKYRFTAAAENKLDFCANCDEVWLDGGEWTQLRDLGIQRNLGSIFTEPWQRRIQGELAEKSKETTLRQKLGEDFERISELRTWIQKHPDYEYILSWLRNRDLA